MFANILTFIGFSLLLFGILIQAYDFATGLSVLNHLFLEADLFGWTRGVALIRYFTPVLGGIAFILAGMITKRRNP